MKNNDWLTHIKNSPVAAINKHITEVKKVSKVRKVRKDHKNVVYMRYALSAWGKENGHDLIEEYKFSPTRKYRSDFAFPDIKILVEYEGGIFMKRSGHNSPSGIQRDISKYNHALSLGFKVLRFSALNYQDVIKELEKLME